MPGSPDDQEKRGLGRPRLGPGSGPSDIVPIRMAEEQKQEMQQAAARAKLSLSEFIRRSVLYCCAPDVLSEIIRQQREERIANDPKVKAHIDEQHRKYKFARRRSK